MKSFKIGKSSFLRVDKANPCPICQKPDWCFVDTKLTKAYCCRNFDSDRPTFAGATVYELSGSTMKNVEICEVSQENIAPNNVLHKVYSLVITLFGLTDIHVSKLMFARGFTVDQMFLRGYTSFTKETLKKQIKMIQEIDGKPVGKTIWEDLFEENGLPRDAWKGVPGFWYSEANQTPIFEPSTKGIFIPNRNEWGQIIGGQIRVDESEMKYIAKVNSAWANKAKVIIKNVDRNKYQYSIYTFPDYELLAEGVTDKKRLTFENGLSFTIKSSAKYVWLSTSYKEHGCGAKNVPHYAFPDSVLAQAKFDEQGKARVHLLSKCQNVIVTEGLLKGDIIATKIPESRLNKLGSTLVISMAGVNSWKQVANALETKTKFDTVFLAFDSDFQENDAVFNNLEKMIEYLHKKGGRTIKVLTWEVGKGLDDFLLSKESLNQKITAHLFYS